jgi:hypothetical protein
VAKLRDRKYNVFAKGKGKGKVGEFNGYRLWLCNMENFWVLSVQQCEYAQQYWTAQLK